MAKVEQAARIVKEQEDLKLASELRAADGKQVMMKIQSDLQILQERIPDGLSQAQSTARDLKYLRDRQETLGCSFCAWDFFLLLVCHTGSKFESEFD